MTIKFLTYERYVQTYMAILMRQTKQRWFSRTTKSRIALVSQLPLIILSALPDSRTTTRISVSIEGKRAAEVTWGDINELSYSDMDKWLETGEARPIAKRCRAAIDDLKAKNRFKDHVFVIVRAVAPDFVTFDFSETLKGGVGVSAGFSQRLSAGIRGKGELKEASRLEIKERLFVGYAPPFKIDDWLFTGFVSGEIVEVRGKPSTLVIE